MQVLFKNSHKKYHVVNFFATYCKPCIKEIPDLLAIKNEHPDIDVHFVSIDDAETRSALAGFLNTQNMEFVTFQTSPDSAGKYIKQYFPEWNNEIPVSLIFDQKGRLVSHLGLTDQEEVKMIVEEDKQFTNP